MCVREREVRCILNQQPEKQLEKQPCVPSCLIGRTISESAGWKDWH